jgi:FdhD protein
MSEVEIARIDVSNRKIRKTKDNVAQESPLHVFLNRTHYATILCSPTKLKELALGHAFSEGIIKSMEEVEMVSLEKGGVCRIKLVSTFNLEKRLKLLNHFSRVILSACGSDQPYEPSKRLVKIESDLKIRATTILDCTIRLNFAATMFRKTGGVHAAAIYTNNGEHVAFAEDVGRHNAVDKVIGIAALSRTDLGKCFLTLTGRLTSDIVRKAVRVGLPLVSSLAAAIDSGITVAKNMNLTLVGFVRGKRMNVYSFPERILI